MGRENAGDISFQEKLLENGHPDHVLVDGGEKFEKKGGGDRSLQSERRGETDPARKGRGVVERVILIIWIQCGRGRKPKVH